MGRKHTRRDLQPIARLSPRPTEFSPGVTFTPENLEFVKSLLRETGSDNTKRCYEDSLRYFWGWANEALGLAECYPAGVDVVLRFIADHLGSMDPALDRRLVTKGIKSALGPHSLRTIELRLIVLGVAHNHRGLDNPVRNRIVKLALRNAHRALAGQSNRKKAITLEILAELLDACERSLVGKRDRALLLTGFASGGRRRSELTAFECQDLTSVEGGYVLKIRRSKTDQSGTGFEVPLLGEAAEALDDWLRAAKITSGKLFRAIRPGNVVAATLSDRQVTRIVKQRVEFAGYDSSDYSAHSLRSGFLTSSGQAGIHLSEAMQMSGHKDIEVAIRYYRTGDIVNNPAARLLARRKKAARAQSRRK